MNFFKDLETIININSYTQNKAGVDKVAHRFDLWFGELGLEVQTYHRELIGDHKYYKSRHIVKNKRLLLLGHFDTVFPPDTFEKYSEDVDWVYGPGVCDMKGGNLVVLQALRRLQVKKIEIENIDILLVSDEETGSDDSKFLTAELAKEYDYCFVYEAAGKNMEVVTARKGVGTFFIDIKGKASHAGNYYAQGNDANLEASYKLQNLVKLTNLEKGTTVNVGKIEGGIGANTISPQAKLTFEMRYEKKEERDRLLLAIDKIVKTSYVNGCVSTLSGGIQRDVMEVTQKSLDLIQNIEHITNNSLNHEKRGGVSDANIVSASGVVTLDGFGPFGDGDHTIYERASKKSFQNRVEMSEKLFSYFIENGDFNLREIDGK